MQKRAQTSAEAFAPLQVDSGNFYRVTRRIIEKKKADNIPVVSLFIFLVLMRRIERPTY